MEKTFFEKMLEVQKELKPIIKDSDNPFFKSKYADINAILAEVKPILTAHGLLLTQGLVIRHGKNTIKTVISDGNQESTSEMVLSDVNDPQKLGACITYFRRYALQSLLALEAEDDDGNTASGQPAQAMKPAPTVINQIGKCEKCGAPMKLSQKTGKLYCSQTCWLPKNENKPKAEELPVIDFDAIPDFPEFKN
jgi:hypothetical protein